ncbi:hypothetical protein MYAM1_000897 [Malassezia yamatoensis]|uniref:Amino acid permease/ SLC12A domain-containing protein n=1 Tax=Malassezia yamatoensis TaxID=253288 RepID=A0AAJ6CGX9_9BASI|nr:hypothetical protein MYAM1_000897 [Malassezia yamatoensis]
MVLKRFVDGFRPALGDEYSARTDSSDYEKNVFSLGSVDDEDRVIAPLKDQSVDQGRATNKEDPRLKRSIKSRHIQFIALGSGIGTGLFIGSGSTLASGGPASLLIDYTLVGLMILTTLFALGEMATLMPVPGAFSEYTARFLDPAWGFAIGYNYLMQWLATFPLEFTAASIVITFWDKDEVVPKGIWIAIFMIVIILVNIVGVRGYAEVEFSATGLKMLTIVGFIICSIVIDCGGAPAGEYLGARGWHSEGGAFINGFKGFCSVLTTAAFAFTGTELVGLAAAETSEPARLIPKACKRVVWRVILFYVLSLLMITLIVQPTDPRLHSASGYDPKTSPFVLTIQDGGIKVLPHIVNAVIMVSALSVANSSVFAASRTLHALAEQGRAPKIFRYVDRQGRPLFAAILSLSFGLLGFLIYSASEGEIFNWLLGISGLSVVITWGSICAAHIRFRQAWLKQGYRIEQLPWVSPLGQYGSYAGLIFNILLVIAEFYLSAFPIQEAGMTGERRAYKFFLGFISVPIFAAFYLAYKLVKRTSVPRLEDIDLVSGRRALITDEELELRRHEKQATPAWKRAVQMVF